MWTTMRPIVDYYGKHAVDVSRICYSEGDANCPAGFTVVNVRLLPVGYA